LPGRFQELEVRISILSIKTEETDGIEMTEENWQVPFQSFSIPSILSINTKETEEIEMTEETSKYLSIFFNPLNLESEKNSGVRSQKSGLV